MNTKTVTEIWVYPVKSLSGFRVASWKVFPKGLEYDRRWMLIDSNNHCMTQRDYPLMVLFKVIVVDTKLFIIHQDDCIDLPLLVKGETIEATIWNDKVEVVEVSKEHNEWMTARLGSACRLVAFPEMNERQVDTNYAKQNEQVSLADGYPILIIGQASLDDLNSRMEEPLPMNRFRPNIVFTGGLPYEEDEWKNISIGKTKLAIVKPCARCVLTTVDQYTGKKEKEPLHTLATYRKRGNNIYFGQNILPLDCYDISVGDKIVL